MISYMLQLIKIEKYVISLIQSGGGKRIYEATATPGTEGANLSEERLRTTGALDRAIRGFEITIQVRFAY